MLDGKCDACGLSCPPVIRIVPRRMGHMLVHQEQEVPSEERCKEELLQLNATIEKGVSDGEKVPTQTPYCSQSFISTNLPCLR